MNDSIPVEKRARRDAWSRYWAAGAPHSCVGTYGDAYGGAIYEFWRSVFAPLRAPGRVLDIATGNAALPRLLLEACADPGVTCEAVDVAEVQMPWMASLPPGQRSRVRLHGGVDAAELPFPDRSFDLAVSQFGLEYTGLERTVPELLRVLRPGAGVALVVHDAGGRPATLAGRELEDLSWLRNESGWLDAVGSMVEPMARASTFAGRASLAGDTAASAAREKFNAIQARLAARARGRSDADLLQDAQMFAQQIFAVAARDGPAAAHAALERLGAELAFAATRLEDLRAHALSEDQVRDLRDRLAAGLGTPVALGRIVERGDYIMGWTLRT